MQHVPCWFKHWWHYLIWYIVGSQLTILRCETFRLFTWYSTLNALNWMVKVKVDKSWTPPPSLSLFYSNLIQITRYTIICCHISVIYRLQKIRLYTIINSIDAPFYINIYQVVNVLCNCRTNMPCSCCYIPVLFLSNEIYDMSIN